MTFREYLADYTLGNFGASSHSQAAAAALAEGYNSSSLKLLATLELNSSSTSVLDETFNKALYELNLSLPSPIESAVALISYWCGAIIEGIVSPRLGSLRILEDVYHKIALNDHNEVGDSLCIAELIALAYAYDDYIIGSCELDGHLATEKEILNYLDESVRKAAKQYKERHCA